MKTNQLNKIIKPQNLLSQFNLSKTIRIDVATGPDNCTIMFLDRRFNYHIIEYSAPKKERDIHTERKEASFVLANGIDKIKITRVITTDQYLVWDELEKALSVTEYPPIHDIDGFQVMIPKGNIKRCLDFKTKKEAMQYVASRLSLNSISLEEIKEWNEKHEIDDDYISLHEYKFVA